MKLADALVSFLPAGVSTPKNHAYVRACVRVAFLSKCSDLKLAMQRALPLNRYTLTQVCSSGLIERAIEKSACDVAIVDIERQDEWASLVFSRFDEVAVDFPVIILCKERHEILSYLRKAQHATDIVSYEAIFDPRFLNLIEAAIFRTEVTKKIEHRVVKLDALTEFEHVGS